MTPELAHYSTIALVVGVNAIGVGIGQGNASKASIDAINIQPSARSEIMKSSIVGMALIETAAIMGITIAFILFFQTQQQTPSAYASYAELGIACAISFSGFVLGLVAAWPAQEACLAIARQPFFGQKIFRFMLITQTIIQTPIIFGFIVAMFIKDQALLVTTLPESIRLIACGLCIGLGSIGPAIGLATFARTACRSLGVNRNAYNKLLTFTFMSEAIIETPLIFSLIVAILLINTTIVGDNIAGACALLGAALSIGLGTIGAGISSGKTAAAACEQIALHPENYATLSRASMFAQGVIDTCAIYALLIALMLYRAH